MSWIEDEKLENALVRFKESAERSFSCSEKNQTRNVIDPFMSLMVTNVFGVKTKENLVRIQNLTSALRGMSNAIGRFHQDVMSSVDGWRNHDAGYDLENRERKIVAEIKNKHNTMNANDREKVVSDLDTAIRQKGQGWIGYLVVVIPRKPLRYCSRLLVKREVYEIDGASFYHKITNEPNAFQDLFNVLCNYLSPSEEIRQYGSEILEGSSHRLIKDQT